MPSPSTIFNCRGNNDINPKYSDQVSDLTCIPVLTSAIEGATDLVSNFCEVCEIVALANNTSYCLRLLHALSKILEFYKLQQQASKRANQFDLFKVMGHQLFVIFYAYLMQERQFALIANLLLEKYDISNIGINRPAQVDYRYFSMKTSILVYSDSNNMYNRAPRHCHILYNLFMPETKIGTRMPFSQFADMDALLCLRYELLPKTKQYEYEWMPWAAWARSEIEGKLPISFRAYP